MSVIPTPSSDPMLILYSLNASEQREFASRMERKQLKEFMTVRFPSHASGPFFLFNCPSTCSLANPVQMYSKMVQRCFDDCVTDFTTKSLTSREEGCVMRCVDKSLKASGRLNERFQEQNAAMMQGQGR